ncbi:unnamed protein product [Medioppia subpectinata]|uniref:Uncharacterized protein n=1 Tax=Medioppia subpectinata TaxID=1979941 RepID=A0A7R9PTJ6_9ACAR|nr:unnamed protein product [Medioppia subpectinata]CAG2100714.1 unnamed protein product [Medioppia subpectinata]
MKLLLLLVSAIVAATVQPHNSTPSSECETYNGVADVAVRSGHHFKGLAFTADALKHRRVILIGQQKEQIFLLALRFECQPHNSTPTSKCETYKSCVECRIHQSGPLDEWACNRCDINPIGTSEFGVWDGEHLCVYIDNNDCKYQFKYKYEEKEDLNYVIADNFKECPEPVDLVLVILLLVLVLAIVVANALPHSSPSNKEIESQWQQFLTEFRSNELQSFDELSARRETFEANYRLIVKHNYEADNGLHSYRLGVNQFADMTGDEYEQKYLGFMPNFAGINTTSSGRVSTNAQDIPESIDWLAKGKVTGVKDQAHCGGCWAFSTTAGIESQIAINSGKLVTLSEENLIDCSRTGNKGCGGGNMVYAYDYIIKNGGIDSEPSYPYSSAINTTDHPCVYKAASKLATLEDYEYKAPGSESDLTAQVANVGPISVGFDASQKTKIRLYKSGVYSDPNCSSTVLNHAVTVVGYGNENGKDFYLVKNSWGTAFGNKGYFKLARNAGNMCGVATFYSWPTGVKLVQ